MLFTAPTSTISNTRLLGTGSRKWRHANILFQRNYTYGWLMLQLITLQKLWWHVVLWMENPSITKTKIYKIYSFLVRTNCTKLMIKLAIDNKPSLEVIRGIKHIIIIISLWNKQLSRFKSMITSHLINVICNLWLCGYFGNCKVDFVVRKTLCCALCKISSLVGITINVHIWMYYEFITCRHVWIPFEVSDFTWEI